jgi:hypothetical protein
VTKDLERVHRGRIPLPEVSGLSSSSGSGPVRLVAVGDDRVSLAVTMVTSDGGVGEWTVITASDVNAAHDGGAFRQLEAAELDGAGTVWVLTEENSRLAGVDIEAREVIGAAQLDTSTIPDLHAAWSRDGASRGEGLLLMRNGHLLVAKEKEPAGLVEFGPHGAVAGGVSANSVLGQREAFDLQGKGSLVALAWWPLTGRVADEMHDLSDIAPDHVGGVWLLSDQSRCAARLTLPLEPGAEVRTTGLLRLPHKIGKPEGLAFLPGGLVAVSDDRHDDADNFWVFRRGAATDGAP